MIKVEKEKFFLVCDDRYSQFNEFDSVDAMLKRAASLADDEGWDAEDCEMNMRMFRGVELTFAVNTTPTFTITKGLK